MSTRNIKKKRCFWGVKCGGCIGLRTLLPSVSRLSRQWGILNISQPYRPPRPVTGIALLLLYFQLYTQFSITFRINTHNKTLPLLDQFHLILNRIWILSCGLQRYVVWREPNVLEEHITSRSRHQAEPGFLLLQNMRMLSQLLNVTSHKTAMFTITAATTSNLTKNKNKLCGLSPRANFTGQETAACRRS
jgi:hypothetical protein